MRRKSLISSVLFNTKTHYMCYSWPLGSAVVNGGTFAISLSGSSLSYLLQRRFKGIAKRMLCYAIQITLNNEGLILETAGCFAGKQPLVLSLLRNSLLQSCDQSCAVSRYSQHSVTSQCEDTEVCSFCLTQVNSEDPSKSRTLLYKT